MAKATLAQRFTDWLIAWRWPLLAIGIAAYLIAYQPAQQLDFDRSIENMFAPVDPILVPFRKLKRTFGGSEVALAAYVDDDLLTREGMQRLAGLTESMRAVEGVEAVVALNTTPLGTSLISDPLREPFLELFEGYTVSAEVDGKRSTAGIACMLLPESDSVARGRTVTAIRELIEAHDPSGVLTGEPVMVHDGFRYLDEDSVLLGRTATLLLMGVIVISFRSFRWVLVPIVVVNLTLQLTRAILVLGNFRLSMVSSMLWAIVTVTGIAMVIHIIVRFREARTLGLTPAKALAVIGGTLVAPIAWTCFTDAAGFGSLLAAHVGPVQDFGVMMVLGSLLVMVGAALTLPGIALAGHFDVDPKRAWGEGVLDTGLHKVVDWVYRWPRTVAIGSLLAVSVSAVGCLWLDVETDFTKNFRAKSDIVVAYQFVEENLGGAGVWDVIIPVPPEGIDVEYLDRIRALEGRLRNDVFVINDNEQRVPGLTKVLSLVDMFDALDLDELSASLPTEMVIEQFAAQMPDVYNAVVGTDPEDGKRYLRIMLRARERQPSEQKTLLIRQVRQLSTEAFPGAEVTGFFVLLTQLIQSLVQDQWTTFGIAAAGISMMMLLAFRSIPLAVVAVIPNVLPILMITGLMGWLGVRINMGAVMIAAVSIGLSVDSSIHYITEFRHNRSRGLTVHDAIDAAHQSVGRAMVFSMVSLVVGFSALCLSQFVPLIYFGVLVSLSMLGGLLGNLVVLPVLLRLITRERVATKMSTPESVDSSPSG